MANDNNGEDSVGFRLDLDNKEAKESVGAFKKQIEGLDGLSLENLVGAFAELAGPIILATTAVLAFKKLLDLTLEAEAIQRVENQFTLLAEQANISASQLKDGMEKALDGTMDLTDAMKSANEAIIKLGPNAEKIPELFEIARKASLAFGGTTQSQFENITQAIANQNTKLLKSIGLKVDEEKAMVKYAQAHGVAATVLSEEGKQAAILEGVLGRASDKYKTIGLDSNTATISLEKLKVSFNELHESIAQIVSQSSLFKAAFSNFKLGIDTITDALKSNLGEGVERSQKRIETFRDELDKLNKKLTEVESGKQGIFDRVFGSSKESLEYQISYYQELLQFEEEDLKKKKEAGSLADKNKGDKGGGVNPADAAKAFEQRAKFEQQLYGLAAQNAAARLELEQNVNEQQAYFELQKNNLISIEDAKIAEIRAQALTKGTLEKAQADALIIQLEEEKTLKIEELNEKQKDAQLKVYDNMVKGAKTAGEGIKAAFAQGGAQAQKDLNDMGKLGQTVFNATKNNATKAFLAIGDGSKSAGEAMKGFLFNSIADISEAQGQMLLASGIGTLNPIQIAEGGALIALAGLLRSQAGDKGGGGSIGSAGGGGGGAAGDSSSSLGRPEPVAEEKKKSVTIQVMGHYFETEQTKQRLTEMIRDNTDATDFRYQSIGVG